MIRTWSSVFTVALMAASLAFAGCDSDGDGEGTGGTTGGGEGGGTGGSALPADCDITEPTLTQIVDTYFAQSCSLDSCHGSAKAGELDLTGSVADIHARLVDVDATGAAKKLVVPGDAANSFLYQKVAGTHDSPAEGTLMPQGVQEPLDPECRVKALELWINAGASAD